MPSQSLSVSRNINMVSRLSMNIRTHDPLDSLCISGRVAGRGSRRLLTLEQAFLSGDILKVGNYKGKGWDILSHETGMIL